MDLSPVNVMKTKGESRGEAEYVDADVDERSSWSRSCPGKWWIRKWEDVAEMLRMLEESENTVERQGKKKKEMEQIKKEGRKGNGYTDGWIRKGGEKGRKKSMYKEKKKEEEK